MRQIILALIFFIGWTQVPISKRATEREHNGFHGPVKKVFVEWSPISGGNYPVGSHCRSMTDVYDESGRLRQHSLYPGSCGEDEIREDYTYAQDGSRTAKSQEIRGKNSSPPPPPAAGRPIPEEFQGPPKTTFKHDSSGKLIEQASVRPSGRISFKLAYSYDSQGRLIETTSYDRDGQIAVRRVLGYSGDDRVPSAFTYYGGDGKVYERTSYSDYEFNSRNDWVKRKEMTEEILGGRSVSSISISLREVEYFPDRK